MDEFKTHAGINISTSNLQVLEVTREDDSYEIINIDESVFNQPLNFDTQKETVIAAQIQSAFDEIQLKRPLKSFLFSFCLPQELFLTVQLPYDNSMLHRDLINEFRWELSLLYPFIQAEELIVQYIEMERNPVTARNTALVSAIEKKHLKLIKNFCVKNNLSLRFLDNPMFAANRFLTAMNQTLQNQTGINLYTSKSTFSMFVNINGKPVYCKVFNLYPNEKISDTVAKELSSQRLKQLKMELTNEAYISGEGLSAELISQLRQATGLNFKQFNPFSFIRLKPGLEKLSILKEKYSSFTPAAGIAFRLA